MSAANGTTAIPAGPPAAPAARPAALRPLVRLMFRGLLGRRRSLGVVLLATTPILVALIVAASGGLGTSASQTLQVYRTLTLGLVIPLVALVLGTGALGTQIDDGTIVYLLVKPVPRRTVVIAAVLVAAPATGILALGATVVPGFLILRTAGTDLQVGLAAGALVAAVLYAAVFVTLSVFTSRALVVGLGYVLIWEGLVTTILTGTRILSIREYALSIASAVAGSNTVERGDPLDPAIAATLSVAVLVTAVALGIWRLVRFEVGEAG